MTHFFNFRCTQILLQYIRSRIDALHGDSDRHQYGNPRGGATDCVRTEVCDVQEKTVFNQSLLDTAGSLLLCAA